MKPKFWLASILMTVALLAVLAVPAVRAVGYQDIVLTDLTRVNPVAYQVTVQNPGVVSHEDSYINMTVFVEPLGTGASHTTFKVLVYLNDGVTNVSLGNKSLAAVDDATVWANLSYNSVDMVALVDNGTAMLTVELWYLNLTATPDDYQMLDASVSTFGIYATQMTSSIMAMVPLFITVGLLSVMLPMLTKMMKVGRQKR